MDVAHFDRLTRSFSLQLSRRTLTGALSLGMVGLPGLAQARKKKRKKRKKRKNKQHTVTFNDFGCVNVGGFCQNNEQCCSGICTGKKDKKECQAHDASTCQAGQQEPGCGGVGGLVPCLSSSGSSGACDTTTGNAPYCAASGQCFPCTKDADCIPFCGHQAACIVCSMACATFGAQTMCVGSQTDSCTFPT